MTMDVETFTARFTQALLRNSPANTNYELTTTLVNALNEAMRTPDSVGYRYPRMLFRNAEQLIVSDSQEQGAAEAEGFSTSPPPPDPAFPKWFTERPVALGGTKVYDLRCVRINSNEEEQQFLAVVNREDWILDAGTSPWGTKRRRALRFGRRAQSAAKGDD